MGAPVSQPAWNPGQQPPRPRPKEEEAETERKVPRILLAILGVGAVALLLMYGLGGRSGGGQGSVSGEVTFNGLALPMGTISFHCQEGTRDVVNALIRDGKYSVAGVRAGPNKVTVTAIDPNKAAGAPPSPGAKVTKGDTKPGGVVPEDGPGPLVLPERYASPESSGLSLVVKTGSQQYSVPLTP